MANKGITQLQVATALTGLEAVPLVQNGITKQATAQEIANLSAGTLVTITNDTATAANLYPLFADVTSGTATTIFTSNPNYLFNPSTATLQAPVVQGNVVVATGGMFVNSNTIGTYTVPANSNGLSAGPMTVTGVVTVPAGSNWVVAQPESLAPWSLVPSAGKLTVEYSGTPVASIDTAGDVTAAGAVTAFGTP